MKLYLSLVGNFKKYVTYRKQIPFNLILQQTLMDLVRSFEYRNKLKIVLICR